MASYPSTPVVFPARSDGQTIYSAHVNALQDEIAALETALLSSGLAHDLKLLQTLTLGGIISPPQITANVNDYAPPGLATASVIRINADAAGRTITGLLAQPAGRVIVLMNTLTSFTVTLQFNSPSSAAGNKFTCPGNVDFILPINGAVTLWYDAVSGYWRVVGDATGSASGATEAVWTPTVTGSTGGASTLTGAVGLYTKIGRRVTIDCVVPITTVGALTGLIQIGGLPFPSNASITSVMPVYFLGMAAAMSQLQAFISPGTQVLVLQKIPAAGATALASLVVGDLTTSTVFRITGSYIALT